MQIFEAKDAPKDTVFVDQLFGAVYAGKLETGRADLNKVVMDASMQSIRRIKQLVKADVNNRVKINVRYITDELPEDKKIKETMKTELTYIEPGKGRRTVVRYDDIPAQFARDVWKRTYEGEGGESGSINIFFGHGLAEENGTHDQLSSNAVGKILNQSPETAAGNRTPPRVTFVTCFARQYNEKIPFIRDGMNTATGKWGLYGALGLDKDEAKNYDFFKSIDTRTAIRGASKMLANLVNLIKATTELKEGPQLLINLYFGEDSQRGDNLNRDDADKKKEFVSNTKVFGEKGTPPMYRFSDWIIPEPEKKKEPEKK